MTNQIQSIRSVNQSNEDFFEDLRRIKEQAQEQVKRIPPATLARIDASFAEAAQRAKDIVEGRRDPMCR